MSNPRRLLVVGGTGFLGSRIVEWAVDQHDIEVDATHLTSAPLTNDTSRWHRCDIRHFGNVLELVNRTQPTMIINAAYRQQGPDATAICAASAEHIARSAAEAGARMVQISTDLVFDGTLGRPYVESDPPSPLGEYGAAKADGEQLVLETNPDSLIVRTSLIYGDASAPQEQLVRRAVEEGGISFFTDEWRNPVNVYSLADAVGRLARSDLTGIIHVAGAERVNRLQFARLLAADLGLDSRALVGGPQDPALGPRASDVSLDTARAESRGLRCPGVAEVLS